ncbi:MAG: MFS transporter [bacterium]|nr:MFS transporter [bacterium]
MRAVRLYWGLLSENDDFRRLYVGRLISFAGDWFLLVPLVGLVYEASGSALAAAAVIAAQALPALLLAPVTGLAADRFDRKKIIVISDIVRAVLALSLLAVDAVDSVWLLLVVVGLEGAGAAFFYPASTGALPNLVDADKLATANVLMSSAWGATLALGAAVGGLFATVVSRDAAFVVNAISFLVSAILVSRIGRSLQEPERTATAGLSASTHDVIRYAAGHSRIAALLTAKAVHALTSGGAVGLFAVMSFSLFDTGDGGTGVLFGARGLGNLIGPLIAFRMVGSSQRRIMGSIGYAMALWGIGYVIVGFAPSLSLAAAAVCLGHTGGGTQFAFSTYGLQALAPDQVRGRLFALDFGLDTLAIAVSALAVGALAATVPIRTLLVGLGLIGLVFGLGWSVATRRYWADLPTAT